MNPWLLSAGALTAVVAAIPIVLDVDPVQPLLGSTLAEIPSARCMRSGTW